MADKRSNDLFKRLTQLFRGGPSIKRKVRAFRTPSASTAVEVFKKSYSQVYSNALNAYGQYDRMSSSMATRVAMPHSGEAGFATLEQLAALYPNGERFLVYAFDHTIGSIVPAWAHHPRQTGVKPTVRVTFDDGSFYVCTPDHECMMRDGTYRNAEDLKPNDSMMPFYRKQFDGTSRVDGKRFQGYRNVYVMGRGPGTYKGWMSEHQLVAEWSYGRRRQQGEHIHHRDHDPENNEPSNLEFVDAKEHLAEHGRAAARIWETDRPKMMAGIQRAWDEDDGSRRAGVAAVNRRDDVREKRRQYWKENNPSLKKTHPVIRELTFDALVAVAATVEKPTMANVAAKLGCPRHCLQHFVYSGGKTWSWVSDSIREQPVNHRVVSVEPNGVVAVGDLTVDGYENFATDTIFTHNSRYADFSEMEYCLAGDTRIATPDGYRTLEQLSTEFGLDKEFYVYAYDHGKRQIVPAVGKQARQTRVDEAFRVTFDDGMSITGTANHRLMLRDGTYARIDELRAGDSMMPFYRRDFYRTRNDDAQGKDAGDGYRWVYTTNPDVGRKGWVAEHLYIAEWVASRQLLGNEVVHHRNFIKWDNRPENLQIMNAHEHHAFHARILNGVKWSPENPEWIERFKAQHSRWMTDNNPAERIDITFGRILETCERVGFNLYHLCELFGTDPNVIKRKLKKHGFSDFGTFAGAYRKGMGAKELYEKLGTTHTKVTKRLQWEGYQGFRDFVERYENHRVVSIEPVGVIPLYDLTVDGYKNFATDTVISHNTPEIASALDIFSEESCSVDEKGTVLHVYSDNPKVQGLLDELYHDVLNIEHNLTPWSRNLPVAWDTPIPLLDGRTITIRDLASETRAGKENWVYSVQDTTHRIVPGRVAWCGMTRPDAIIQRTWLDDGSYVDTTPDHEFVMRDGTTKRADGLLPDDSLMPFYRRISSRKGKDLLEGYEKVYDPGLGRELYTHRSVMAEGEGHVQKNRTVIHHVDFDKRNNRPDNLRRMDRREHIELHARHCKETLHTPEVTAKRMAGIDRWLRSDEHREVARGQLKELQAQGLMRTSWEEYNQSPKHAADNDTRARLKVEMWQDPERRERASKNMQLRFDDRCLDMLVDHQERLGGYVQARVMATILSQDDAFLGHFRAINAHSGRDLKRSLGGLVRLITKLGAGKYHEVLAQRLPRLVDDPDWKRTACRSVPRPRQRAVVNHKVVRTEVLPGTKDAYCMEVLGPNAEHDRHNFSVCSMNIDGRVMYDGLFVRNCKYGDFFAFVDVHPEMGVINAFPMPVNEVERDEGWDPEDPLAVRFRWVTQGNQLLDAWQVAHFRLTGNDAFLPYGSSVLESARRIWRQLVLIEDAMLVYRVVRSPERRIFYIDVGTVPTEEIPNYMEAAQSKLKRAQVIDKQSGRIDLRYNPLPVWSQSRIPLLDGRTITIQQLAREYDEGKENWVYSVQDATHRIVPGRVAWCGKNYTAEKLVRVWLDDGTWVMTAPEHPFLMRDGSKKRADELKASDSLMPLYRKLSDRGTMIGYPMVMDPSRDKLVYLHRAVAEDVHPEQMDAASARLDEDARGGIVVHHRNFNRLDASPSNLEWMTSKEHLDYHASIGRENIIRYNKSDEKRARTSHLNRIYRTGERMGAAYNGTELHKSHNAIRSQALTEFWADPKQHEETSKKMAWNITPEYLSRVFELLKQNPDIGKKGFQALISSDAMLSVELKASNRELRRDPAKFNVSTIVSRYKPSKCTDWMTFKEAVISGNICVNHSVIRTEFIEQQDDVYCMTVVGPNGEDDRHNFGMCSFYKDTEQGYSDNGVIVVNSVDEDYFIPVRGDQSGTRIETLAGGQHVSDIADVEYIQKKLFAALKIPKAYLGYDEALSCVVPETQVPLLDGRILTIEQMHHEFVAGRQLWVYSIDRETQRVVPGRVVQAGPTRADAELVRVTLDDGGTFDCTPDHRCMLRDGSWREAERLRPDDSLMPLYRRRVQMNGGADYEQVLDPHDERWRYTHRVVAERSGTGIPSDPSCLDEERLTIHHVDIDRFNNAPGNLLRIGWGAHRKLHQDMLEETRRRAMAEGKYSGANNGWAQTCASAVGPLWDIERLKAWCVRNRPRNKREMYVGYGLSESRVNKLLADNGTTYAEFAVKHIEGGYKLAVNGSGGYKFKQRTPRQIGGTWVDFVCATCGLPARRLVNKRRLNCSDCLEKAKTVGLRLKRAPATNHRVVSVEKLTERRQTWCISVEEHENFAIAKGNFISNSKATLAQEDIRFSRSISHIQRVLISELEKIGQIHLFSHGYEGEDLIDFSLHLSNPSSVAQMQKLELWRMKFEIAGMPLGSNLVDRKFLQKEIFQLSDAQIEEVADGLMEDHLLDLELESQELEGNQPSGGSSAGGLGGLGGGLDAGPPPGDADAGAAPAQGGGPGGGPGGPGKPDDKGAGKEEEGDLFAGDDDDRDRDLLVDDDAIDDDDDAVRGGPDHVAQDVGPHISLDRLVNRMDRGRVKGGKGPARTTAMARTLYNRGRKRNHGAHKTHLPNFRDMLVHPLDDPYDTRFFSANPFHREDRRLAGALLDESEFRGHAARAARLPASMRSMLSSLGKYLGSNRRRAAEVLVEDAVPDADGLVEVMEDDGTALIEAGDPGVELILDDIDMGSD